MTPADVVRKLEEARARLELGMQNAQEAGATNVACAKAGAWAAMAQCEEWVRQIDRPTRKEAR